jgi:hypothetical protein
MANSNYTLSSLNGVSDEARCMVIVATGTNSAVWQIVAPLVKKFYIVNNNTTGGYAVTIGGATGSIVSIPNGTVGQVYCDGTNFFSAQTGSAGNFNVNGTLTVGSIVDTGPLSATTITAATQFSGPGTGLTGTAASLTVGVASVASVANTLNTGNSYTVAGLTSTGAIASSSASITSGAPTLSFIDTDGNDFSVHVNSNLWYVLNQGGAGIIYTDQSGNFTAAGNVTAYSDERLKTNWRPVQDNFVHKLAGVKSGVFERTDIEATQVGVSAQSLQFLMPEAVQTDKDGLLTVNYGAAAMVSVVELAKELAILRAEIKQLKGE